MRDSEQVNIQELAFGSDEYVLQWWGKLSDKIRKQVIEAIEATLPTKNSRLGWNTEAVKRVFLLFGYVVESCFVFTNKKKKVAFYCLKGQHSRGISLASLLRGSKYGKCIKPQRTQEEVFIDYEQKGYIPLPGETFSTVTTNIQVWCTHCGVTTKTRPSRILAGTLPFCCSQREARLAMEKRVFAEMTEAGMIPLEGQRYVNNSKQIYYYCTKGDHVHHMSYSDFQKGVGCYKCQTNRFYWDEEYATAEMLKRNMIPCSDLSNVDICTKVEFFCLEGFHYHAIAVRDFLGGTKCGACHAEKAWNPTLKYSENSIIHVIASRSYRSKKLSFKKCVELVEKTFSSEQLQAIADLHKRAKELGMVVDHIIPCSFWDMTDADQLALCWSLFNLRILSFERNHSRLDSLTVSELLIEATDKQFRSAYNQCSAEKKAAFGLPQELSLTDSLFKQWSNEVEVSEKDKQRFLRWSTKPETTKIKVDEKGQMVLDFGIKSEEKEKPRRIKRKKNTNSPIGTQLSLF